MHYFRHNRLLTHLALIFSFCMAASLVGTTGAIAAPLAGVPAHAITLPAGGTATLDVRGIALHPGATLPSDRLTLASIPLAQDRIRTTLFYGIDWGYAESAADQVALAVWYAQDGVWRDANHTIAERIVTAAGASQGTPSWRPDGRSLLSLVGEQITLRELTLVPLAESSAIGRGRLTLSNTSEQDVVVYLPYGTLFTGPSGDALVWATESDGTEVEEPGETIPTATPLLTDPPPAEETATPSYKSGTTPEVVSTPSYKATRPSPTPVEGANLPPAATAEVTEAQPTEVVQVDPTPEPTATAAATQAPITGPEIKTRSQSPSVDKPQGEATQEGDTGSAAAPLHAPPTEAAPPSSGVSGPPPELPRAQPTTRGGIPSPVGTESAGDTDDDLPVPVATGGAGTPQPTIPRAQQTTGVPVVITPSTRIITPNPTATQEEKKEAEDEAAGGVIDGRSSSDGAADSAVAQPVPQPVPVAPLPEVKSPDVTVKSSDSAPAQPQEAPTAAQLPASSPPTNSPATGGGPSGMGSWLAACAALLLIAGIQMRRASMAQAITVSGEQNH